MKHENDVHTQNLNFRLPLNPGSTSPHPNLTRIYPSVTEIHLQQTESPVPQVIEAKRHPSLLDGQTVLKPNQLPLIQWSGIGDALQLADAGVLDQTGGFGWDDDLGGDVVGVAVGMHDGQGREGRGLFLAKLGVGGTGSGKKKVQISQCVKLFE